ncbi:MAG: hypothetical protein OEM31_07310 [Gammaproteobacteria bacterium]|nr:hypothetical protein [Gammaproteobacteria bacterium]
MFFSILGIVVFAPGCATITSTVTQPITVTTKASDGDPLDKVDCVLSNDSGNWRITTPAEVSVERSANDLLVTCKKEGHADGFAKAISRAAPGMWGNILVFAGVGAIIDHNTGAGYNYPRYIAIRMGTNVTIDRLDEDSTGTKEETDTVATTEHQPQMDDNKLLGP